MMLQPDPARLFVCPANGERVECIACGQTISHRREELAADRRVPACETHNCLLVPERQELA